MPPPRHPLPADPSPSDPSFDAIMDPNSVAGVKLADGWAGLELKLCVLPTVESGPDGHH